MNFPRDAYPYTNFHELNLGYFITHFREIFSQWADLYDQMTDWKDDTDEELETWKAGVEADLTQRETALRAELEAWKTQTGQDIGGWEDATLAALTAWQTATQAVFEAIRVEAAGSATAAAASAGDASTAKTAAETAQAAAEAAAATIIDSAALITTNTNNIAGITDMLEISDNVDLEWKAYQTTATSRIAFKSSPASTNNILEVTADLPSDSYEWRANYYDTLAHAEEGYAQDVGSGSPTGSSGWVQTSTITLQADVYVSFVIRRHSADTTEEDTEYITVSSRKSSLVLDELESRVSTIENTDSLYNFITVPSFLEKENRIKNAISAARENCIVFGISADCHYNDYDRLDKHQTAYAAQMNKICAECNVDFIATLGDLIEGVDDGLPVSTYYPDYHSVNERRLVEMAKAYTRTDLPYIYIAGHHESYPISDSIGDVFEQNRGFYTEDIKLIEYGRRAPGNYDSSADSDTSVGYRKFATTNIQGTASGSNYNKKAGYSATYYFDIVKGTTTTRFIALDSCAYTAYGYSDDTLSFLETALSDAAEHNIKCFIFAHIPLKWREYRNNAVSAAENEAQLDSILEQYNTSIIAYFHGHIHGDNIVDKNTVAADNSKPYENYDFPIVAFSCQKMSQAARTSGYYVGSPVFYGYRKPHEYKGYCFSIVTYNYITGAINIYRYGAGDHQDGATYPTWSIT